MNKNKKGFTLIEILIVIGIIALVTAIAVPSIMAINKKMKQKVLNTKEDLILKSAENYAFDNANELKKELNKYLTNNTCETSQKLTDGGGCKCENEICKYVYIMTVEELITVDAYKSEKENESDSCHVENPVDSSCLDSKKIVIELPTDNKNAKIYFKT